MKKLIEAFKKHPTYDNARKVWQYDKSHPMAACLLSAEDIPVLDAAIRIAIHAQ